MTDVKLLHELLAEVVKLDEASEEFERRNADNKGPEIVVQGDRIAVACRHGRTIENCVCRRRNGARI